MISHTYQAQLSKTQALTYFVSEMAGAPMEDALKVEKWLLHMDGYSTTQGSGVGIVITSPYGEDLEFAIKFGFKASNNEAEYEALVIGMRLAYEIGARNLVAYSDSQLIVKQVEGTYEAKEENMIHYLQQIAELKTGFESFQLIHIPREENVKTYCLSKLANALEDYRTRHITIQHLPELRAPLSIQVISSITDWRTLVIRWLEEGHLPNNRWDASRLKIRATRFLLQRGVLYKKFFTYPLLRCLSQPEGTHVPKINTQRCYGAHTRTWTLANKALRASYF
ncbi:UNVERIFIED_CONTAM: Ribonuclease HI [Sesamum radiatum]|uniref:Ribonuclease HI n=1 Tax=Sesamum radiatum TaxID=300843 RepID=A0AAW2JD12_SESRA